MKVEFECKAAILHELHKPLIVGGIAYRGELKPGQVLVQVHVSGICGKQVGEVHGRYGPDQHLPHLLGHEGGGEVLQVGPGVTKVVPGDRVVLHWRKGSGIEASFPKYVWQKSEKRKVQVGGGKVTTFCEKAIVSENRITRIPDAVPYVIAALLGCGVTTGLGIVQNEAKLKMGESIAVAGCGGVGLNVIQGAKKVGASRILAIDRYFDKVHYAKLLGANELETVDNGLSRLEINHEPVDVFIDCTGNPEMIDFGMRLLNPGGRMILVGQPHINEHLTIHNFHQHYKGKTIMDSQGGSTNPGVDIPRYANMYLRQQLRLDELVCVDSRYPLDKVNQAMARVETAIGRIVLVMSDTV